MTDVVATPPQGWMVTDKLLSENPGRYRNAASEEVGRLMFGHGEGPIAGLRIGTTVATNALQARPETFVRHIARTPTSFECSVVFGVMARLYAT